MNVFEAVKQNLTTRQAAEMYGIRVSRHGMAVCPFHNDKNPSMKVDKRFHCFACQADGDAVDFVSRLFGLPSREAAVKLADDFGISYDNRQKHRINSLTWDGTERIRCALPHFLGAEESEFTYECLRLFMLGAISRVFKPGSKFETMLCLVGGQGAGKSTFFRLLAIKDEWFSDDLKRIDDDNVYRKMQGHWIIEMSEMIATANAKSIEDIKSFISRAKETYKVPYETHPADRLRQCVFGGSSNTMDFLPLDRSGNRRFLPIMVHPERAEVHILEDEAASRAYIDLMWAEAMTIYRSGSFRLTLSKQMNKELRELQKQFMPEDTKAGLIQSFLDDFSGTQVCSKLIYAEALNHSFDEPKQWEIREINEIMNNSIEGWTAFSNPRIFAKYGRQRGWERADSGNELSATGSDFPDGFHELTEEEAQALEVMEQEESDPENDEMIEIINSTVGKLQQIEDKYYYSLDLNYYLNNLEDDAYEA